MEVETEEGEGMEFILRSIIDNKGHIGELKEGIEVGTEFTTEIAK